MSCLTVLGESCSCFVGKADAVLSQTRYEVERGVTSFTSFSVHRPCASFRSKTMESRRRVYLSDGIPSACLLQRQLVWAGLEKCGNGMRALPARKHLTRFIFPRCFLCSVCCSHVTQMPTIHHVCMLAVQALDVSSCCAPCMVSSRRGGRFSRSPPKCRHRA